MAIAHRLLAVLSSSVVLAFQVADVEAALFRIGGDGACSHTTLQAAINALPASGQHEIRLANSATYGAQAIAINGRVLTLRGGYATCSDASPATVTTLSGAGGSQDSVLTIRGIGNDIVLEDINVTRGDEVSDGYGGGIDFNGIGVLTLRRVAVSQNYAGYGGGISVIGENGEAELRIEAGTVILLNTAQYSGGGIRLDGRARLRMDGVGSTIVSNEALGLDPGSNQPRYGYGGGLEVIAPARALIGSPGIGNGAIVANSARYGGGIAVVGASGREDDSYVTVYSTDPAHPVRIHGNRASNTGGGVYLGVDTGVIAMSRGNFCAFDARIDENIAAEGSAIYHDSYFGTIVTYGTSSAFNRVTNFPTYCSPPAGSVRCAAGIACNTMQGNRTRQGNGTPTDGATVLVQDIGSFDATRLAFRDNIGGHVIRAFDTTIDLDSVVFSGNTLTRPLLSLEDDADLVLVDTTIGANAIAAPQILAIDSDVTLTRAILWQPGLTTLTQGSGSRTVSQVIASETASLGGGASSTPPRFVDEVRGDVTLRAASPAIDRAVAVLGNDTDVESRPRDRRLGVVPRDDGFVRDLGAHERQLVAPLLYNTNFDADDHHWFPVTAGVSSWDGTQNAVGTAGSGAIKVTQANTANLQRVSGLRQCIHLPGPGVYALNGSGRSGFGSVGNRDYLYLNWEFRRSGGEPCDVGVATASGDHFLANSPSWQRPAQPKLISVTAADFTSTSSITVTFVVTEFGTTSPASTIGWFDGITLDLIDPNDTIFRNGFD